MPDLPRGYQTFTNLDLDAKETILAAPGTLFGYELFNESADTIFVHFYDALIANVTVGTTAPKWTVGLQTVSGSRMEIYGGMVFTTGITIAATTTPGGSTEPGANECQAAVMYLNTIQRQGA
jgi:hypothetical protein